jgi:hypothetical protein
VFLLKGWELCAWLGMSFLPLPSYTPCSFLEKLSLARSLMLRRARFRGVGVLRENARCVGETNGIDLTCDNIFIVPFHLVVRVG